MPSPSDPQQREPGTTTRWTVIGLMTGINTAVWAAFNYIIYVTPPGGSSGSPSGDIPGDVIAGCLIVTLCIGFPAATTLLAPSAPLLCGVVQSTLPVIGASVYYPYFHHRSADANDNLVSGAALSMCSIVIAVIPAYVIRRRKGCSEQARLKREAEGAAMSQMTQDGIWPPPPDAGDTARLGDLKE